MGLGGVSPFPAWRRLVGRPAQVAAERRWRRCMSHDARSDRHLEQRATERLSSTALKDDQRLKNFYWASPANSFQVCLRATCGGDVPHTAYCTHSYEVPFQQQLQCSTVS